MKTLCGVPPYGTEQVRRNFTYKNVQKNLPRLNTKSIDQWRSLGGLGIPLPEKRKKKAINDFYATETI